MKHGIRLHTTLVVLIGFAMFSGHRVYAQNTANVDTLSPQVIFDQANSQLHQQQYTKALQLFHVIEKRKVSSGPLYLNMAFAYTKLDSMGLAKYYFMKAEAFPETVGSAQQGLAYTNGQLSHESAVLPELPWDRLADNIRDDIGIHTFLFLSILLLNLGIIAFIAKWFIPKWQKMIFYTAIVLLVAGVLGLGSSFYVQNRATRYEKAVMVTTQDNVYDKPEKDSGVVSNAYEGYVFTVDRERSKDTPDWYYIRMSNGQYGWVQKHDIRIL